MQHNKYSGTEYKCVGEGGGTHAKIIRVFGDEKRNIFNEKEGAALQFRNMYVYENEEDNVMGELC